MKTAQASYPSRYDINAGILREYDIRGLVGKTLGDIDAYFIGRAFGTMVKRRGGKSAVVGFDGRESSPGFAANVMRGLTECGLDVDSIGLGPTPMTYFAMKSRKLDAAVMVTGSHSPLSYNGIKMAYYDGPFYGAMVKEIGRIAAEGDFETAATPGVSYGDDGVSRGTTQRHGSQAAVT